MKLKSVGIKPGIEPDEQLSEAQRHAHDEGVYDMIETLSVEAEDVVTVSNSVPESLANHATIIRLVNTIVPFGQSKPR